MRADDGKVQLIRLEEVASDAGDICGSDGIDAFQYLFERADAPDVYHRSCRVARYLVAGFKRESRGALDIRFRLFKLHIRYLLLLYFPELRENGLNGLFQFPVFDARLHREVAGVGIPIDPCMYGIGQPAL